MSRLPIYKIVQHRRRDYLLTTSSFRKLSSTPYYFRISSSLIGFPSLIYS